METGARETITPQYARKILERDVFLNRRSGNLIMAHVKKMADTMRRGAWDTNNPQPVIFDYNGRLIDGFNRFSAVAESGLQQTFFVIRGADPSGIERIDRGLKPRTDSDSFGWDKRYGSVISAAALICYGKNPTDAQVKDVFDRIGEICIRLVKSCPSTTRFYSGAQFKLAAALSIVEFDCEEYAHDVYYRLVKGDFVNGPPVCAAIARRVSTGTVSSISRRYNRLDILALGRICFDPQNWHKRKIILTSRMVFDSESWVESLLYNDDVIPKEIPTQEVSYSWLLEFAKKRKDQMTA